MTIEAELPNGTVLEFPDGTSDQVIQSAVQGQLGVVPQGGIGTAIAEPLVTLATGAVAEPLAGLAGIGALLPGGRTPTEAIEETREALTFQPRTQAGQAGLETVGEVLQPVGEAIQSAETTLGRAGEAIGQATGIEGAGAVGGAIGETIPTAVLTALGIRKKAGGAPDITPQRAREIQDVLAASQRQGVDVLTSDIFQPKSIFSRLSQQFSERVPVFGTGGKRAAQQQQRIDALDNLDQSIPRVETSDIFNSLNESANKARVAAGGRINAVTELMGPKGAVTTDNAVVAIDKAIERLRRPGKLKNEPFAVELENLKQTLGEAEQSFGSLREFRTDARAIAEKVDPQGRSQLRSGDKAFMDSVVDGITNDLDSFVLGNSDARTLGRYKAADKIYAQEAAKLTKSRLKTVLDKGEVKPELVNNLLFSSSPSEVKLLFNNLDTAGRQNARLSLYRRALDNATKQGEISPQRFVSELDKLGNNFKTFFRGQDRAELNGLKKLLETTKRAAESGVVTPTGQALQLPATTAVIGGAAIGDARALSTLFSASTIGLGARAYESAGVRNMLIRLGKAPKRSTLEVELKGAIPLALEKAGQEITQEEQSMQNPSVSSQNQ